MDEILLNIESKERRYAHLRNGLLYDLIVERKKERQLAGNIYRGRVTNILQWRTERTKYLIFLIINMTFLK